MEYQEEESVSFYDETVIQSWMQSTDVQFKAGGEEVFAIMYSTDQQKHRMEVQVYPTLPQEYTMRFVCMVCCPMTHVSPTNIMDGYLCSDCHACVIQECEKYTRAIKWIVNNDLKEQVEYLTANYGTMHELTDAVTQKALFQTS